MSMIGPPLYQARPITPWKLLLSRVTLALVFGLTFFYPIVVAVAIACLPIYGIVIAVSSIWWPAMGPGWMLDMWCSYFELRVWRDTPELTGPALFVMVPHGVFPMGLPLLSRIHQQVFPDLRQPPKGAVASIFFWIPFLAPLVRWLGGIPADKHVIRQHLEKGVSCFLFPDGVAGAYHGVRDQIVCLEGRTSFERLARASNVPIIPVYCFGHTSMFEWSWPAADSGLARWARRLRVALIWYWPIVPRPQQITLVFGHPIKAGERYEDEIAALYARYANACGCQAKRLKFF
jgi:1-acyl-sn-glycerol-3-phosphate acyltransferase